MKRWFALGAAVVTVGLAFPVASRAQAKALPPIALDLRDAPIRQALEQLFNSAGVQFSIDNNVAGFITLKIQDQPFESALRLIMRASSVPLTYTLENNVYFVKPRPAVDTTQPIAAPPPDVTNQETRQYLPLEQIQMTYVDPFDLTGILGVKVLTNLNRKPTSSSGSIGGGGIGGGGMSSMMSGIGGMSGGMGGIGGGSSMGGIGGGMSSIGGMSGGGLSGL